MNDQCRVSVEVLSVPCLFFGPGTVRTGHTHVEGQCVLSIKEYWMRSTLVQRILNVGSLVIGRVSQTLTCTSVVPPSRSDLQPESLSIRSTVIDLGPSTVSVLISLSNVKSSTSSPELVYIISFLISPSPSPFIFVFSVLSYKGIHH